MLSIAQWLAMATADSSGPGRQIKSNYPPPLHGSLQLSKITKITWDVGNVVLLHPHISDMFLGNVPLHSSNFFLGGGAKDDWDFQISDLVKTLMELIFNPCGEFQWSPVGPVSQIHSPPPRWCPWDLFRSFNTLNTKPELYSGLNVRLIEPSPSLARFLVFYITRICMNSGYNALGMWT